MIIKGVNPLPAYGRAGRGQHLFNWRRILRSKIRKIAAAKKRGRGGNSFSPHPFFFPPRPSGIFKNQFPDFRQKKFGFCPKGTAIFQNWSSGRLLPRPRGVYPAPNLFWCGARARQKPRF